MRVPFSISPQTRRGPSVRELLAAAVGVLALATLLAGCGGSTSNTTATPSSPPGSTGTSASPGTSTPATSGPSTSADKIVLALVTPLSEPGDYRSGTKIKEMAEIWVQQVNESGGIGGRSVELAVYDDQGKPEVGSSAVERAITEKKAAAIIGIWHSSVSLAEMEVVKRYNVPMLAFYSWADKLTGNNYPQVFRIGPYNSIAALRSVDYLTSKGYKKIAMLAEDTDAGIGFGESLSPAAKSAGLDLNVVQFQAQAKDLTAQLSKIAAESPELLIIESVYAATNIAINQAREVGFKGDILATWEWPTLPDFWPTVGKNGVGVTYVDFYDKTLDLTSEGKKAGELYKNKYDVQPVVFQYFLWDTMNALKVAIEKSGSAAPADIIATLPSVSFEGTTDPQIVFTNEAGTLHFHQWENMTLFFKQLTAEKQPGEQATLVFTSKASK